MLSSILNDALLFASTPDLASVLLASRRFSAVADEVVARRTLRAVWIRHCAGQIHVTTALSKPSGEKSFQFVTLSASDDVEQQLRPLLLGGIVEVFGLQTNALADRFCWFADVLRSLVVGGIVSRTLRLHLSNDASLDSVYALVEHFHYVKAVEVHYDDARRLDFAVVDHDAHHAKCVGLGIRQVEFFENGLCSVLALRDEDAHRILQACAANRPQQHACLSTIQSILVSARPGVFQTWKGSDSDLVRLQVGYKDMLAKWTQGSSA